MRAVALPAAPALVAGASAAAWLSPEGEIELLPFGRGGAARARATPPFLCHARATARRLGVLPFPALDLLELFAFVRPARFCLPTPRGLAAALGLAPPRRRSRRRRASRLRDGARRLLAELAAARRDAEARAIAQAMERGGWGWAGAVLAALPRGADGSRRRPGSRNGAACRNGRSTRPSRRPATSRSRRARRARAWPSSSATAPRRGRSRPITPPR